MQNREEAQSLPLNTSSTNGSDLVLSAETDGLSLGKIIAAADEDQESVGRI